MRYIDHTNAQKRDLNYYYFYLTVDLVIILHEIHEDSRGQIRKLKNLAKIMNIIIHGRISSAG